MPYTNFPNRVGAAPARGVPGDKASLNPVVHADGAYLAGDAAIMAGRFVWPDPAGAAHPAGPARRALSSGSGAPLGLVERGLRFADPGLECAGSLYVPQGATLSIVRRGDMYVAPSTPASAGQKVFAALSDGSVRTGDAGDNLPGAVETDWTVTEGGPADTLITITNWSA